MKLAGALSIPTLFPGKTSLWELTAAQVQLLLGPTRKEKEKKAAQVEIKPLGKSNAPRRSLAELQALTKKAKPHRLLNAAKKTDSETIPQVLRGGKVVDRNGNSEE